jgi:uncharacterized protein involved in cysteine biosynthesis
MLAAMEQPLRIGPVDAVSALISGMRLCLADPVVRGRVQRAFFINAIAFVALLAGLIYAAVALTEGLVAGDGAAATLGWLARVLVAVGLVVLAPALFNALAGVCLPLVEDGLFRAARERAGGPPVEERSAGVRGALRDTAADVGRLVRLVLVALLLLPLNLVPGLGSLLYLAAQGLHGSWTLGQDLLEPHFALHGVPHPERRRAARASFSGVLTLGAFALLLSLVPVAQLFFVSSNVAGAGVLSARLDRRGSR